MKSLLHKTGARPSEATPILNETGYEAVLIRVYDLMDAKHDTPEGEELNALVDLVRAYEIKHVLH